MLGDSRTRFHPLWPISGSNFQSRLKICWCKSQTGQASWMVCWHGCLHEVWTRSWIHLLSVAYENFVGAHRSSWRVVSNAEKMKEGSNGLRKQRERWQWALRYLQVICCLFWKKKKFIPSVWQAQSKVIYLKMKGDYYCYLVQVTAGDDKKGLWISHSKPTKMLFKTEKENATKNILLYWVWAVNSLCSIVQSKLPRESLLSCKESFFPYNFIEI